MHTFVLRDRTVIDRQTWFLVVFGFVACLLAGCAVPVHRHRLVSKANMQFSESPVFNYQSKMLSQVESGAAAAGGAQAAGCTSCR